ncbi:MULTISPECIES: pyridoxamine 5'-phosphate oxidase family protein [Streptomyces]|uniref:pyridoxamine 5'-phosphate oxidase family protein n=1 Tax=Streptomyces TaxID=1883 RepID=UPI002248CAA4|nr:pyridoxamine 5'-phosphate oxidase family protein [Streptomyces sp. JHD 1]MCX2968307.1 pyridoxamine 5'-phosphate oxidase family protein [Streptomyces sp. JHD 1]
MRPDPRPHVAPVAGAWHAGALWFCSLPRERKVENLSADAECSLLTGTNEPAGGVDAVLEGRAVRVTGTGELEEAAEAFRRT